jgi:predicted TIM-barrel fold metal-dependent hydrolase
VALLTDGPPLVDAHCHVVTAGPVDAAGLAAWCTEASSASTLDSQTVFAVRRWCPPVLGLPAHAPVAEYLAARDALGPAEVTRRLLGAAGLRALLVDTGLPDDGMVTPDELGRAAGAPVAEVVRLEALAQRIAPGAGAAGFAGAFTDALAAALGDPRVVAVKSIVAYRYGLDLEPGRPEAAEVARAAGTWMGSGLGRLVDPVLLRFLLWSAVDADRPVQLHTGFGDADAVVARSDPGLLHAFCAATRAAGTPLVLLHCYPYHRQAGWLAHLYPHVHVDVGLTLNHVGARAPAVLAEFLELAPFDRVHYSSDAFGLPELYLAGAAQFRHALATVLDSFVHDGAMARSDADRTAVAIGAGNAARLYGLDEPGRLTPGR